MNKVLVGFLISAFGILLFAFTVLKIIPTSSEGMKLTIVGISWIFIIIGSVMRYKALSAQHKEMKAQQKQQQNK
ncbi:hypothetical protein GCM10007425_27660 [Lysinibacillus alkalisoli]|uniref:Uncharacterized protein n=1 Tax=Lysinibacillus alkalisoli TaxID=1911548 RepID=A0A917G9L8_9BACI|nr:hypothetical protein [Lysinibacillus alkalisoli]GGG31507.1 hypothetical protein GCM10007425_27660 [Lysinibacillus alkalisoli]